MALAKSEKIWMNGRFIKWDDAKIHVLSHVVHYGSSVFEGMRAYKTKNGAACFRLQNAGRHHVEVNPAVSEVASSIPVMLPER